LSAVFLLAMALPALCGKCDPSAAKSDCAEDHGGKMKKPGGSSSGYTDCDHCHASQGIAATRRMQPDAPQLVILLRGSDSTSHQHSNRIASTSVTSATNSVLTAVQRYIFVGRSNLPRSVYSPLTVSLKI